MKANFVRIMNLYGLLLKKCWKLDIVLQQPHNSAKPPHIQGVLVSDLQMFGIKSFGRTLAIKIRNHFKKKWFRIFIANTLPNDLIPNICKSDTRTP